MFPSEFISAVDSNKISVDITLSWREKDTNYRIIAQYHRIVFALVGVFLIYVS